MIKMKYSASTKGFYVPEIHGSDIPADAVEITDAQYVALMDGQGQGQEIAPDENGYPVLITPEVVPYIPELISMRQCRLQLLADGVLGAVSAAIATMPETAQIEWEYGAEVLRENPLVAALMAVVGWDEERTDQFFIEANGL